MIELTAAQERLATLTRALLDARSAPDHWEGHLSSSALSTGTAVLALHLTAERRGSAGESLRPLISAGVRWLVDHRNEDGGWGDTVRSRTNISTTAIAWATLSMLVSEERSAAAAVSTAESWLRRAAGGVDPDVLRRAILERYGTDRTFSVPILTVLALTGKLGPGRDAWRSVPQLPFELAAVPHAWFQHLSLPVVSYALPALIAIGQVRHHRAPSRNPLTRALRGAARSRTHRALIDMQPASGGYLEATPLTSFVVMSLVGAGLAASPVVESGVKFLADSIRPDGSWPIDTNLSTWVTTLSIGALADACALPERDGSAMREWLLRQQSTREHPFTHAAPGAWAWTPLSGGVPDADDTAGALIALRRLGAPDDRARTAAAAGLRWLLGVQNRDGGIPTFCRGWGTLPFDRSTPEITAHALRAWSAWHPDIERSLRATVTGAADRALGFLRGSQRPDGRWVPLWFGNEHAPQEENPVYGTARVLLALDADLIRGEARAADCRARAVQWLLRAQNHDGGWGGDRGVMSSIEETGIVLAALGRPSTSECQGVGDAFSRGGRWITDAVAHAPVPATPLGLYFAKLWYYEELYPPVFAIEGLASVVKRSLIERAAAAAAAHAGPDRRAGG